MSDTIKEISNQLSKIFRYLFSGTIVIGFSYLAHPSWFYQINFNNSLHISLLGIITILTGNIWYVIHRYTLHQLIDILLYIKRNKTFKGYAKWLTKFLVASFKYSNKNPKLSEHLHLRSSQIIWLFIVSQSLFLFSFWYDSETFFSKHCYVTLWMSIFLFFISILQYILSNELDFWIVNNDENSE